MAEKRESNKRSIGQLTVDIDCSEALKGLKAIAREAKKATRALKELEEQRMLKLGPGACEVCGVNHNHCMCPKGDKPKIYIDGVSEPFTAREGEVVYVLKDEEDIEKIAKAINELRKKESGIVR